MKIKNLLIETVFYMSTKKCILFFTLIFVGIVQASEPETYICTIKEQIDAKFKKGRWVHTGVSTGAGVFRITVKGHSAEIFEQGDGDELLKTKCKLVGGTVGFECEEIVKVIPDGERFEVSFFPYLKEITIRSEITLREIADYEIVGLKDRKYFDGVTLEVKEQYGQCSSIK